MALVVAVSVAHGITLMADHQRAGNILHFSLLGIAIILDLMGVMSSIMPGASFVLVIAYFLGVSGILRFVIA